jgi:hypothetical protein
MVSDPLRGIAVLVDEAEAAAGGQVLRHEGFNERCLAAAARADDVGVLAKIAVSDRNGFFVRYSVSENSRA